MTIEIVDFPINNGDFPVRYVNLPEAIGFIWYWSKQEPPGPHLLLSRCCSLVETRPPSFPSESLQSGAPKKILVGL